jgi:hypothetical protein
VRFSGSSVVKDIRDDPWRMLELDIRTADGQPSMFGSAAGAM